jgi:hydroxyethylthiazole kinase-like uncharacterized protein yjeF
VSADRDAATPVAPDLLRRMPLPHPGEDGDKDQRGRVLVVGGSLEVPGAALLAGVAALRAGAGKLQIATARSIGPHLALAVPEALVAGLPETEDGGIDPGAAEVLLPRVRRCDAVLVGPGMMDQDAVLALTARLLSEAPAVSLALDAPASSASPPCARPCGPHAGRVVITPHAGEMAALLDIERDAVEADPLSHAREAASLLQVVVALKGGRTHIVTPQGAAWTYAEGQVGLATSGSGDVLAGVVAGLLARGATPVEAAIWGVALHGEAGNRLSRRVGPLGFLARELLSEIPGAMRDFGSNVP